jgi:hypothetical protein
VVAVVVGVVVGTVVVVVVVLPDGSLLVVVDPDGSVLVVVVVVDSSLLWEVAPGTLADAGDDGHENQPVSRIDCANAMSPRTPALLPSSM